MKRGLFSGLRARVILTYLVIFLVSAAIMAARAGSLFAERATESAAHDLEVQAFVLSSVLERPWSVRDSDSLFAIPQLQILTGRFAQGAGGQLTILDGNGNTLATSLVPIPVNQQSQPEVAAALDGSIQHDIRYDPVVHQIMIYAAAPVQRDGRILAVVQLAVPLSSVTAETHQFWLSLGLTALLAAVAAALSGWLLADQLVQPVARLRNAAARLAGGNLDERVPPKSTGGVAEIAELANAFNHMAERIEDMITSQRAFVANASHELRTPLTNIRLRAEALGDGALEDPTVARRFVGDIGTEANRLARMANDLLALTRQDATPAQARDNVNLGALVADISDEMHLRAAKADVEIVQEVEPDLPSTWADPDGLHTVLLNLVDNALQYTPEGGTITISASQDATGHNLVLQVHDTGSGIPEEDIPHIFERFYRADKARSRRMAKHSNGSAIAGSGAGLGLAIVHGIVEEHQGMVSVQSIVGQGTTMIVMLPLRQAPELLPALPE